MLMFLLNSEDLEMVYVNKVTNQDIKKSKTPQR